MWPVHRERMYCVNKFRNCADLVFFFFLLYSSNNHHLSNEVKTWKERILKKETHREVSSENSPQSPKVTRTASKKRPHSPSQCKEQNLQDPVPRESPKSWFFDSRSKSLPHPVCYFDNSGLGLCPGT